MGVVRTNWQLGATDLNIAFMQSQLVILRQTWQHDSATGDVLNISFDGYGRPVAVFVARASQYETVLGIRISISATGSVFAATIIASASMGSIAATVSYPYNIIALIGSR